MVIVHSNDMVFQDKVKSLTEFTVIPTAKGMMIHGPTEQIVEKIKLIGKETSAEIVLDVFDGGECKHYAFNEATACSATEKVTEAHACEQPATKPAAPEIIANEEPAIIEETSDVDSEPKSDAECEDTSDCDAECNTDGTDEEAPAEDDSEAVPAPEAKTPAKPTAPKQEVTFKNHK